MGITLLFSSTPLPASGKPKPSLGTANVKSGLSLRTKPETGAKKILTIPAGREFFILDPDGPQAVIEGKSGRWFQVKYRKKTGWVFGGFVTRPAEPASGENGQNQAETSPAKPAEPLPASAPAPIVPEDLLLAEKTAMAKFPNLVRRDNTTLYLKLKTGDEKLLTDVTEPNIEGLTKYRFLRYLSAQKLFLVFVSLYEGHQYLLISEENGMESGTDAEPVFSPDGKRFFSASCDLVAGFQDNEIEVFSIDSGFIQRLYLQRATQWGPVDAAWESDNAIRFVKLGVDGKRPKARLTYDPAKDYWTLTEKKQ
jgi:hypothetical protein